MERIGFIGLGTMGKPMAANLVQKGYAVTVYNRTADKAEDLARLGARTASSPAEAARAADVLITIVSNDEALKEIFYGSDGIMNGLSPEMTVIDCSTVSPDLSKRLHRDLAEHGVDFLDAPVTGSKPHAEAGTLTFMVGGRKEVLEKHLPVLHAMGTKALYMGPPGSGSYTKLAHNTIAGINVVALSEGMAIAAKSGIDPEKFLEVVLSGGANSRMAEMKGGKMLTGDFSNQFSLQLMLKDLKLSSRLSGDLGLPTPLLHAAQTVFQMGMSQGLGPLDMSSVVRCYENWADIGLVSSAKPSGANAVSAIGAQGNAQDTQGSARDDLVNVQGTQGNVRDAEVQERRRSVRIPLDIRLFVSVYQWEREGSFSGQQVEAVLCDLSDNGLQIASEFPLAQDMFVVLHFPQEAGLPPITAKIIRVASDNGIFRYGCLLSGIPPYIRAKLEDYIGKALAKLASP